MNTPSQTVEEIAAKIDALDAWKAFLPCNIAVKPRGIATPYFCSALPGDGKPVKMRLVMLEGWQTLHDFVRSRADSSFGYYTSPIEFPHLELVFAEGVAAQLFRHDTGFMPVPAPPRYRELAARIVWEIYGIMLRLESEPNLSLKYAEEGAVFARLEDRDGVWSDQPLAIPDPKPFVESVALAPDLVKRAKDLPFSKEEALAMDFRLQPRIMTREKRPRTVYELLAVNAATGARAFESRVSLGPDGTLADLWQSMPNAVLGAFVARGRVPGDIRLLNQRVFRLLRPLCVEFPFKLSIHDQMPALERAFAEIPQGATPAPDGKPPS